MTTKALTWYRDNGCVGKTTTVMHPLTQGVTKYQQSIIVRGASDDQVRLMAAGPECAALLREALDAAITDDWLTRARAACALAGV